MALLRKEICDVGRRMYVVCVMASLLGVHTHLICVSRHTSLLCDIASFSAKEPRIIQALLREMTLSHVLFACQHVSLAFKQSHSCIIMSLLAGNDPITRVVCVSTRVFGVQKISFVYQHVFLCVIKRLFCAIKRLFCAISRLFCVISRLFCVIWGGCD